MISSRSNPSIRACFKTFLYPSLCRLLNNFQTRERYTTAENGIDGYFLICFWIRFEGNDRLLNEDWGPQASINID
ncbi:hypothetical protein HA466_0103540 [Hirschfeldia incana]|nr:hypothetical protein HA466_0103540 [Hirschfeldia incana]